jgi:hypothetical protein
VRALLTANIGSLRLPAMEWTSQYGPRPGRGAPDQRVLASSKDCQLWCWRRVRPTAPYTNSGVVSRLASEGSVRGGVNTTTSLLVGEGRRIGEEGRKRRLG